MTQQNYSYAPPLSSTFPIQFSPDGSWSGGIQTIEVDNGSNLTLSVYADNQLIRTVGPYISRFNLNTSGGWQSVRIVASSATIQPSDSVTIILYDSQVVPPLLPAFGVSSWGGGSTPNALIDVNPGDNLMAWQVEQIIQWIAGDLDNSLVIQENTQAGGNTYGIYAKDSTGTVRPLLMLGYAGNVRFYNAGGGGVYVLSQDGTIALLSIDAGGNVTVAGAINAASADIAGLTIDSIGDLTGPGRISSQHCGGFNKPLTTGVTLSPPSLISNPNAPANTWFRNSLSGIVPPSASTATFVIEYSDLSGGNGNPAVYVGSAPTSTIWVQSFSLNANRAQLSCTIDITSGYLDLYIASSYLGAPDNELNIYVTHYEGES